MSLGMSRLLELNCLEVFYFNVLFFLDLDTQIIYKLKEIDRIKQEVDNLRFKRTRCDEEAANLRKRLASCTNAIRELPFSAPTQFTGTPPTSSSPSLVPAANTL